MNKNILIYRNQLFKLSETFIVNQANSLKEFNPIYIGRKSFSSLADNSNVISLDSSSFVDNLKYILFRDTSYFYNESKKYNPKLIHAHFGVEGVYALKLSEKLNIPLVTTFHGFDATITSKALLLSKKPAWINYLLFRKELAKRGDLFICVSNFIRDRVIKMGFPKDRVVTHYIGIDTDIKVNSKVKKPPYKIILHVARLVEKKGTIYLLKAFSRVVKEYKDVKLVIIGTGPLEKRLKKVANELNLKDRVLFLGALPYKDVLDWMQKAYIFSLPSIEAKSGDSEGLGMVFLEAALYNVPSVATYHGGIPEAVLDKKSGLLVAQKDDKALSEALLVLLKDESLREEFGEYAKRYVKEKFDIKKETSKLEMLYKGLL